MTIQTSGAARQAVAEWLADERAYAESKWPPSEVDKLDPDYLANYVREYLHRSLVLGMDNPLGRQALAKSLRTLLAMTESIVRRYGPLPIAGVSSGTVVMAGGRPK